VSSMRKTELGLIPKEWTVRRIQDICEKPQYGFTESANGENVGPRFLRITDIVGMSVNWDHVPYCICPSDKIPTYRLKHNDIVFARIGATTGKSYIIKQPPLSVFASYLIRLRTKSETNPDFLCCYFNSPFYWSQVNANKGSSLKGGINGSILSQLQVICPSLPEQRKIAAVLAKIQRAVGWEVAKIGGHAIHVGSGVTPRGGSSTYLTAGIPLIRSQNVLMNSFSLEDVAYISPETHHSMSRSKIHPNDVLLNITGASIGRVAVVPASLADANVNQHVCCIRLKSSVEPHFLSYFFATKTGQRQIMNTQIGTTRQGLNYQQVRGLLFPCPDKSEQAQVASMLRTLDEKLAVHELKKAALQDLFKTTLNQLMTGAVRVMDLDIETSEVAQ